MSKSFSVGLLPLQFSSLQQETNDIRRFYLSRTHKPFIPQKQDCNKKTKRTKTWSCFCWSGLHDNMHCDDWFRRSSNGALHCATVLPLSKILPAFISLMSLAVLGTIFLSEQQTDPKAQTPLLGLSRNKSVTNERFVKCRRVRLWKCVERIRTVLVLESTESCLVG